MTEETFKVVSTAVFMTFQVVLLLMAANLAMENDVANALQLMVVAAYNTVYMLTFYYDRTEEKEQ